jgi:hypothetical protein
VQAALDEYSRVGRESFLSRYGFEPARSYLVINPKTGDACDSKAIAGAAFGYEHPNEGPLLASEFSGGVQSVVAKLTSLGYRTVSYGEDWSEAEVAATVAAYFDMLRLESRQEHYNKKSRNTELRRSLNGRSAGAVEMKHANVSAVLDALGLPFVSGYKPRSNVQHLLRQLVQTYVSNHKVEVLDIVEAFEEVKTPGQHTYAARLVSAPDVEIVPARELGARRLRLPRKTDFAARDEANRKLGREGELWVLGYEQYRLTEAGIGDWYRDVAWVADTEGDGLGYDIRSVEAPGTARFIEVKTTNAGERTSFIVSRNELEFSREAADAFYLYRLFDFRANPRLYTLRGDLTQHVELEPIDFRASFRRAFG